MDMRFFQHSQELREWLATHHDTAEELLIGFNKTNSGLGGLTYPEALDEALCFGWIDGVRKRVDEARYTIRFTPRKAGSTWSTVNVERVRELTKAGRMHAAGMRAFEARDEEKTALISREARSRDLEGPYLERLRACESAWSFFQEQAPSYRRMAAWWVMSAKKEETRQRRLAVLIEDSANGRRIAAALPGGRTLPAGTPPG